MPADPVISVRNVAKKYKLFGSARQRVLEALQRGAWGVLVASCPEDECEHEGSRRARARLASVHQTLERLGIEEQRLRLETVPKGGQAELQKLIDGYLEELRELGPLQNGGGA